MVSPIGENSFAPISHVAAFQVALAKAEAHHKADGAARAEQGQVARSRNTRVMVLIGVAVVVAAGAAIGARYLAVHNPFKTESEDGFDITVDPPTIALAKNRRNDEELLDYPTGGSRPKLASASPTGSQKQHGSNPTAPKPSGGAPKMSAAADDPDGMQTAQFDQGAINSVVASHQKQLFSCFREEAARNPGFAAKIPLEFVIGNNGRVAKLWVDHPSYKTGPMADCLLRELQKWPFKPYEGENATVSLSFNIGKRG
jgi:hypothetical protein